MSPTEFTLYPASPYPFNQRVALNFTLPSAAPIKLIIYDITGREIINLVDSFQSAGSHSFTFDGAKLSSGVYFARLAVYDGRSMVRKIVLMK